MAIINQNLGGSTKRQTGCFVEGVQNTATGNTYLIGVVPYNSYLMAASQACQGLSGSPNHSLWVNRFAGTTAGVTSICVGYSLVAQSWGTSGSQGFTVSGTTFTLLSGDVLLLSTAAANTATVNTSITYVLQALQDIVSTLGV
jgi:hypothetical protein